MPYPGHPHFHPKTWNDALVHSEKFIARYNPPAKPAGPSDASVRRTMKEWEERQKREEEQRRRDEEERARKRELAERSKVTRHRPVPTARQPTARQNVVYRQASSSNASTTPRKPRPGPTLGDHLRSSRSAEQRGQSVVSKPQVTVSPFSSRGHRSRGGSLRVVIKIAAIVTTVALIAHLLVQPSPVDEVAPAADHLKAEFEVKEVPSYHAPTNRQIPARETNDKWYRGIY